MNDLNTIIRQNAKAVEASIPQYVADGKHVVARYAGLSFVDFSTHDSLEEAEVAANEYSSASPDRSTRIHSPVAAAALA